MSDVEKAEEETKEAPGQGTQEQEKPAGVRDEPTAAVKEVLEQVKKMTVLELAELVKALEETFGVSAAAPVAMMAMPQAAGGPAQEAEEKTSFDVVLAAVGEKKIQVIKAVRAATNLGTVIKAGVTKDEAGSLKGQLEEAGATVELK